MTKTFFIIPGFKQKPTAKDFVWLKEFLADRGFKVVIVPIKWNYRTMSDWVEEFIAIYNANKTEDNYILGFSYGAVIAFLSANTVKPKKILLCSLSSDFKEDIPSMQKWIRNYVGKKRMAEMCKISAVDTAKKLKIPSVVFYGDVEGRRYPQLKIRCEETTKIACNSKLVIVKDAPHDIAHPNYRKAIESELFDM